MIHAAGARNERGCCTMSDAMHYIDGGGNIVNKKKGPVAMGPKSGAKKTSTKGGKTREQPKKNGMPR
jgi:hypothetical protein